MPNNLTLWPDGTARRIQIYSHDNILILDTEFNEGMQPAELAMTWFDDLADRTIQDAYITARGLTEYVAVQRANSGSEAGGSQESGE